MNGVNAGLRAFRDPESHEREITREQRLDLYTTAWMYYRNTMFTREMQWQYYLARRDMYKYTRLIYNPVPQIVDFYVDNIWQPPAGDAHEEHEALATPLSPKTAAEIKTAVEQIDQWSNWLSDSAKIKRYAAALGNVLIEGIDDLSRGKVLHRCVWPGHVVDLELNATGDVQSYALEYTAADSASKTQYLFRKEVTKETISYFRDGKPFTPDGKTASVERTPYGFCFAVWLRHTDDGSDYGVPACHSLDKVNEMNSLASHLHDNIHKLVESPKLISTEGEILPLIGATGSDAAGRRISPYDTRLDWTVLKAAKPATVHDLAGGLQLAEAHPYLMEMLASFADDYPELQAATIIRENSQLSGAALERMLGPAQNRLDGAQANYNQQLTKLRQMQTAVAGFRANGGGWGTLSRQQAVFRDFGLASYERGDLDFHLTPSLLVNQTESETENVLRQKADRAVVLSELIGNTRELLSIAGYSDSEIDDLDLDAADEQPEDPDTDAVQQQQQLAAGGTRSAVRQLAAAAVNNNNGDQTG